jgi:hypothetical protein
MSISEKYVQYGVPSSWAAEYEQKKIPITTYKNTSNQNLREKYQISESQIEFVKHCLQRTPITPNTLQALLHNSLYLCCVCHGTKSDAYIIHHVDPYSNSQSNEYHNLAVLCPNDHDLAHREGLGITSKLTKENILHEKRLWEREVEDRNVRIASQNMDIHEVDYMNAPRILSLFVDVFHQIPSSKFAGHLIRIGALNDNGSINEAFTAENNVKNNSSPFNYFGPSGSWVLGEHHKDVFKQILNKITFVDLDSLLNKKKITSNEVIGEFCYYVGGLYGTAPENPITDKSPLTHLYFHRKTYFIEWLVDPKYIVSVTAESRISSRPQYLIYGRILSVGKINWKGKEYVHIDIRPYLFGIPNATKSRKPGIHYRGKYDQEIGE